MAAVSSMMDVSAAGVKRYEYGDYGRPTFLDGDGELALDASGQASASSSIGNRHLFTGRLWDWEIGLYDYRWRVMDPGLGLRSRGFRLRTAGRG